MAQEIPHDLTLSALKIEPSSISTNPVLDVNGNMVGYRRNVITLTTTTDRELTVAESGSLININNSVSNEEIIVGLPTIEAGNVGTFYEFVLTGVSAGDTTRIHIQTGGHATTINEDNRTANYDDFIGGLNQLETTGVAADDVQYITPSNNNGELVFDSNLINNLAQAGTRFRCTAIAASTTTANTDVWLLEGTLIVSNGASTGAGVFVA